MKNLIVRYRSADQVPHCSETEALILIACIVVAVIIFAIAVSNLDRKRDKTIVRCTCQSGEQYSQCAKECGHIEGEALPLWEAVKNFFKRGGRHAGN